MKVFIRSLLVILVPFVLVMAACSGTPNNGQSGNTGSTGSTGSTSGPFTIGGTVSALAGTGLVLQDNGGDNLSISASGTFTFRTAIAKNGTYAVTILTQPAGQTCSLSNPTGTATANVTNISVVCNSTTTALIGGQVSGLSGSGLVLQDNGGDNLTISQNGTFAFHTPITLGKNYSVTVLTQPSSPAQVCTVAGGTGIANANVGNIVVTCSVGTLTVGGSVSGLDGTGLVLADLGGTVTITGNGTFTFPNLIPGGVTYNVTVATQPSNPAQTCTVSDGTGSATANVTSIQVICPAVYFPVGGTVVGMIGNGGGTAELDNTGSGGDELLLTGDGPFTFVNTVAYGSSYSITAPGSPSNNNGIYCVIWGDMGVVLGPVTSITFDCGHNDWSWLDGSNSKDPNGSTATPPTIPSSALDSSSPGGRTYAAAWTDASGNLWLFGGIGWDTTTQSETIYMNDMWEFSGTGIYYGGYNTYWVQDIANDWSSGTSPLPRASAVSWTDPNTQHLMLFGGQYGELGAGAIGIVNDLWSFDTGSKTWTQIAAGSLNANGVYNAKGSFTAGNLPGARWGATAHLDSAGNLWLFGGLGYDANSSTPGLLNDLWEYTAAGQWIWMSGSNAINQDGVYGTEGTAASSNVPGGRQDAMSWVDSSGNFWLFGGYALSPTGEPGVANDLWEYINPSLPGGGQWKWVSGANTVQQKANYGIQGTAAVSNVPGARSDSATWIDASNRLWFFGGQGYDATANGILGDLWYFDTTAGEWTWIKGPSSVTQPGTYGLALGETDKPFVQNFPGGRWSPASWRTVDTSGNYFFWLFGGYGYPSTASGGPGNLNDLWRYLPYP